jgi:hypothetical protein
VADDGAGAVLSEGTVALGQLAAVAANPGRQPLAAYADLTTHLVAEFSQLADSWLETVATLSLALGEAPAAAEGPGAQAVSWAGGITPQGDAEGAAPLGEDPGEVARNAFITGAGDVPAQRYLSDPADDRPLNLDVPAPSATELYGATGAVPRRAGQAENRGVAPEITDAAPGDVPRRAGPAEDRGGTESAAPAPESAAPAPPRTGEGRQRQTGALPSRPADLCAAEADEAPDAVAPTPAPASWAARCRALFVCLAASFLTHRQQPRARRGPSSPRSTAS